MTRDSEHDERSERDPRLDEAIHLLRAPVDTDAETFDARVLGQLASGHPRAISPKRWPVTAAIAAMLLVGIVIRAAVQRASRGAPPAPSAGVVSAPPARAGARIVRFQLADARARSVAIAGSFNAWSPDATPLHRAPDGTWSTKVALSPGRHVYQFVVDHAHWIPDPHAPRDPGDDFGTPNSVITVLRSGSGS